MSYGELMTQDGGGELSAGESMLRDGMAMQQIKTPYATAMAVQRPRKLADVDRRLQEEARLSGEGFYYGWAAGKDRIEGPSQELAFAAARCWGNCAVEQQPVQDMPDAWVFTATFVDLETGFTYSRQFRQSKKWTVAGKMDGERKDDIRFQIGQTKAARNVILKALPGRLVEAAMETAKAGVRSKIEGYIKQHGIAAAVDIMVKALAKEGVKPEQIAAKFSVADTRALSVDNLVVLKGDLAAIQSGQERADAIFPRPETDQDAMAKDFAEKARKSKQSEPATESQPRPQSDTPADSSAGPTAAEAPRGATPTEAILGPSDPPAEPEKPKRHKATPQEISDRTEGEYSELIRDSETAAGVEKWLKQLTGDANLLPVAKTRLAEYAKRRKESLAKGGQKEAFA